MSSEQIIETEATVRSVLPGTMFRIVLKNGHELLAHPCGKMRKRFIRLTPGDQVKVEISSYDMSKARIVRRIDPPRFNN